jgi:formylglycine-generating enzyme
MRTTVILSIVLLLMVADVGMAAEQQTKNPRILVAYFSWSGNTREIAKDIHRKVGGDLFEIVPATPYPTDYNACLDQSAEELKKQYRPPLKAHVANMKQYDVIFLGYPNWWATIPMPVASFLEEYDLSGKKIVPFCSHGGGRLGQSTSAIAKLCPKSNILEALSIYYNGDGTLQNDMTTWLRKIGIKTR